MLFRSAVDETTSKPAKEAAAISIIHFLAASNVEAGIISAEKVDMNSARIWVVKPDDLPDNLIGSKTILAIVLLFYG